MSSVPHHLLKVTECHFRGLERRKKEAVLAVLGAMEESTFRTIGTVGHGEVTLEFLLESAHPLIRDGVLPPCRSIGQTSSFYVQPLEKNAEHRENAEQGIDEKTNNTMAKLIQRAAHSPNTNKRQGGDHIAISTPSAASISTQHQHLSFEGDASETQRHRDPAELHTGVPDDAAPVVAQDGGGRFLNPRVQTSLVRSSSPREKPITQRQHDVRRGAAARTRSISRSPSPMRSLNKSRPGPSTAQRSAQWATKTADEILNFIPKLRFDPKSICTSEELIQHVLNTRFGVTTSHKKLFSELTAACRQFQPISPTCMLYSLFVGDRSASGLQDFVLCAKVRSSLNSWSSQETVKASILNPQLPPMPGGTSQQQSTRDEHHHVCQRRYLSLVDVPIALRDAIKVVLPRQNSIMTAEIRRVVMQWIKRHGCYAHSQDDDSMVAITTGGIAFDNDGYVDTDATCLVLLEGLRQATKAMTAMRASEPHWLQSGTVTTTTTSIGIGDNYKDEGSRMEESSRGIHCDRSSILNGGSPMTPHSEMVEDFSQLLVHKERQATPRRQGGDLRRPTSTNSTPTHSKTTRNGDDANGDDANSKDLKEYHRNKTSSLDIASQRFDRAPMIVALEHNNGRTAYHHSAAQEYRHQNFDHSSLDSGLHRGNGSSPPTAVASGGSTMQELRDVPSPSYSPRRNNFLPQPTTTGQRRSDMESPSALVISNEKALSPSSRRFDEMKATLMAIEEELHRRQQTSSHHHVGYANSGSDPHTATLTLPSGGGGVPPTWRGDQAIVLEEYLRTNAEPWHSSQGARRDDNSPQQGNGGMLSVASPQRPIQSTMMMRSWGEDEDEGGGGGPLDSDEFDLMAQLEASLTAHTRRQPSYPMDRDRERERLLLSPKRPLESIVMRTRY